MTSSGSGGDHFHVDTSSIESLEMGLDKAGGELVTEVDGVAGVSLDAGMSTDALSTALSTIVQKTGLALDGLMTTITSSSQCREEYVNGDDEQRRRFLSIGESSWQPLTFTDVLNTPSGSCSYLPRGSWPTTSGGGGDGW